MLIFKRLLAALAIFLPLGAYVFGLQILYDKVELTQQPFLKATVFLIVLIVGSAAYDFTKTVLSMQKTHFQRFFVSFRSAWFAMIALLVFATASAFILEHPILKGYVPSWVGYFCYICSLICIPWFVSDLCRAIDTATQRR